MDEQHGFRPGRSTSNCNILFCNYVFNSFQCGSHVDAIYTDFNKAFDSVNHQALILVLKESGLGKPLNFFLNFFMYTWIVTQIVLLIL